MSDPELDAMRAVATALEPLDVESIHRTVRWAAEKFGLVLPRSTPAMTDTEATEIRVATEHGGAPMSDWLAEKWEQEAARLRARLAEAEALLREVSKGLSFCYWCEADMEMSLPHNTGCRLVTFLAANKEK